MRKIEDKEKQRDTVDRLKFEKELAIDAEQDGYFDDKGDIMAYKDMTGMTEQERNFEMNKRAARRNFFLGSKIDQEKVKESYKPAQLRNKFRLKGLPEKHKPFSEEDFRMKVRESRNKIERQEKGTADRIFYTHLSKSRRGDPGKERPDLVLKNCRRYLDFMEKYVIDAVKEKNKERYLANSSEETTARGTDRHQSTSTGRSRA